ncbi:MAG: cation diffusion facilitator family transporter, partial [Anaerolineae bacterium]
AALVNAGLLIALSLLIAFEALMRLQTPPDIQEQWMVSVGALGFVVNAAIALSLLRDSRRDLNVRSAFIHMTGDAAATVGVVLAGLGIAVLGWHWLDPAASLVIAALIVWSAWGIVHETVHILLESAPRGIDVNAMVADMRRVRGVRGVHDLHVWSIAANLPMLSAHVLTDNMTIAEGSRIQREINERLMQDYGIHHTALQLECEGCDPDVLYCDLTPGKKNGEN